MRTKEEAHDYRYFPDPDLLPLEISEKWIKEIWASRPKSREERYAKIAEYGIPENQVSQHAASTASSTFVLATFADMPLAQVPTLSNWILGPLAAKFKQEHLDISQSKVFPDQLKELSKRVADGTISATAATSVVLPALWEKEGSVDEIIEKRGLKQISDADKIEKNRGSGPRRERQAGRGLPRREGKGVQLLVGQVMKETQGKANPAQVNEILKRKLTG